MSQTPNFSPSFDSLDDEDVTENSSELSEPVALPETKNEELNTQKRGKYNNNGNGNDDDLPTKYCKYQLFGICKSSMCHLSHNIKQCQYISARKMNPCNKDITNIVELILSNKQISHLNFGRNQLSKKAANDICNVLMSDKHDIKSLALDSTFIGKQGFKSILQCSKKLSNLRYLDLSDLNLMPSKNGMSDCKTHRRKNRKNGKNRANNGNNRNNKNKNENDSSVEKIDQQRKEKEEMMEYQRCEVIDIIIQFLTNKDSNGNIICNIQHLILGHNDFTFSECSKIVYAATEYGGLITLDLYGNKLTDEELYNIDKLLYNVRKAKIIKLLLNKDNIVLLPNGIAFIICQFVMNENESLYRCHKWKPFAKISNNKMKNNDHPSISYKRRSL